MAAAWMWRGCGSCWLGLAVMAVALACVLLSIVVHDWDARGHGGREIFAAAGFIQSNLTKCVYAAGWASWRTKGQAHFNPVPCEYISKSRLPHAPKQHQSTKKSIVQLQQTSSVKEERLGGLA